ncbi:LytS/YhcK type 5TM receptor domain-containing protein [Candidatus Clostridium stratigraminis]|uniref:histidine kinase n=1 Tax=Candidatus Clostridium stratigraminis TaxID=3381661 RepID=A0ABW8T482_9CLOT
MLIVYLAERMSIIIIIIFILSTTRVFKKIFIGNFTTKDKIIMIIFFSILGITGSYTGIRLNDTILNSRAVGALTAGILGGPVVGIATGIIVGVHRYFIGGFTSLACGIAAVLQGVIGGMVYKHKGNNVSWRYAGIVTIIVECLEMALVLLLSKPFTHALQAVKFISMPMIIVNTGAVCAFMLIIDYIHREFEFAAAVQAQKALSIADETLPYLRHGLNEYTAKETAEIIYKITKAAAVSITDKDRILAFIGLGSDHHKVGEPFGTELSFKAIQTGKLVAANTKKEIACKNHECSLSSVVLVPLKKMNKVVGLLKIYKDKEHSITPYDIQLTKSLGSLFSTQLELYEIEHQESLAKEAEIKALQAQINPHFLFNTISTISSLIRTDPDLARNLLLKFSNFFRYNIQKTDKFISLKEELNQISDYIEIEKARYGDKLKINTDIDESCLNYLVPPITLQPLIENAIKHGIKPKAGGGTLFIEIKKIDDYCQIKVSDDGIGVTPLELQKITEGNTTGIGLKNVIQRIVSIFGEEYAPLIESEEGRGTTITIKVPPKAEGEVYYEGNVT